MFLRKCSSRMAVNRLPSLWGRTVRVIQVRVCLESRTLGTLSSLQNHNRTIHNGQPPRKTTPKKQESQLAGPRSQATRDASCGRTPELVSIPIPSICRERRHLGCCNLGCSICDVSMHGHCKNNGNCLQQCIYSPIFPAGRGQAPAESGVHGVLCRYKSGGSAPAWSKIVKPL